MPRTRPAQFRLNPASPLARGLAFAGLGRGPGAGLYIDNSPYRGHGTLTNYSGTGDNPGDRWKFDATLGRWTLSFDGVNDHVTTSYRGQLQDFTVACWFLDAASNFAARLVDKSYANGFWLGHSTAAATWGGGCQQTSSPYGTYVTLPAGWRHLAMTRAGTFQTVTGNGSVTATATVPGTALDTTALSIGSQAAGADAWSGSIADVMVWSRALSAAEVAALADPSNPDLRFGSTPLILPAGRGRAFLSLFGGESGGTDATATAGALAATGTLGTATVTANATTTGASQTATGTLGTATVTAAATTTVTALAATGTLGTATVTAAATTTATALDATGALGTATVTADATTTAAALDATGTLGTATVSTDGGATATATALDATGTLGTATPRIVAPITGSAVLVDDVDPGAASLAGSWTLASGYPDISYGGTFHYTSDSGAGWAWSFPGLTPGAHYRIFHTYFYYSNRTSDIAWSVRDGSASGTVLASGTFSELGPDLTNPPGEATYAGRPWDLLAADVTCGASGTLVVRYDPADLDGSSVFAAADAVLIDLQDAAVALAPLAATGTLGTVSVSTASGVTATVTALAMTGTLGTPTVTADATTTATALAATGTLGTVSVSTASNVTTTVTALAATGTLGTVAGTAGALVSASSLAATGTLGTVTVSTITYAPYWPAGYWPAGTWPAGYWPAASAAGDAVAAAAPLAAAGILGTAAIAAGATAIPAALVAAGTLGTVAITTASGIVIPATPLAAAGTLGTAVGAAVRNTTIVVAPLSATGILGVARTMAADDLYEAIYNTLAADAGLTAAFDPQATGRPWLWLDLAPEDAALPVAVISQVTGTVDWEDDPAQFIESGEFDAKVYAGGATARRDARSLCRRVAAAIEAADATLTYGESDHLYARRSGLGQDTLDPERAPDGSDVWGHAIPFRVIAGNG